MDDIDWLSLIVLCLVAFLWLPDYGEGLKDLDKDG